MWCEPGACGDGVCGVGDGGWAAGWVRKGCGCGSGRCGAAAGPGRGMLWGFWGWGSQGGSVGVGLAAGTGPGNHAKRCSALPTPVLGMSVRPCPSSWVPRPCGSCPRRPGGCCRMPRACSSGTDRLQPLGTGFPVAPGPKAGGSGHRACLGLWFSFLPCSSCVGEAASPCVAAESHLTAFVLSQLLNPRRQRHAGGRTAVCSLQTHSPACCAGGVPCSAPAMGQQLQL